MVPDAMLAARGHLAGSGTFWIPAHPGEPKRYNAPHAHLPTETRRRAEGKTDQATGKVKQVAEKAVDKVEQAVKKVRE